MRIHYRLHVTVSAILAVREDLEAISAVSRAGKTETKAINFMMEISG